MLTSSKHKRDFLLMVILFAFALILRLYWIVSTDFNGLYGQDAYAYYDFALELRQALNEWRVPEPFFWGLGYPSLLMSVSGVFGASAFVAQMLNMILGSLLVVLLYVLARQIGCERFAAALAALLLVVCGQAVQSSIVVMADIPALFWTTLSAMLLVRYVTASPLSNALGRGFRGGVLYLSALFLTIAGVTRWLYFGLAPLWAVVVFIHWRGRIRWHKSMVVIVIVLALLIPQFAYSRTTPFPTFSHAWVVGWSPDNALQQSFTNADGQFYYATPNVRFYAAPLLDSYYLSPVLIIFFVAGIWALWRKSRLLFLLLVGWIVIPYLFLIGIPYQNIRFPLISFPPIVVLIGVGVQWLIGRNPTPSPSLNSSKGTPNICVTFEKIDAEAGRYRLTVKTILRPIVVLLWIVAIMQTLKTSDRIISTFIDTQQQDKAIAAWVMQHLPTDATLYTFEVTLILRHETPYTIYDLFYETPESLDAKWIRGQHDFLLINGWSINHQWRDREPYIATYWLVNERGIVRIGRFGNYGLYRVRG